MGFRVWGLRFRVWGLGYEDTETSEVLGMRAFRGSLQGSLGFGVWGSGVQGLGLRVQGLGLRVHGLGFRV